MLTGTQLWMKNGACDIHIECEDYNYEDYTIVDGKSNGLASVSPVVAFKTVCTNVDANIFEINHIDEGFFCGEHNMEYIHKAIADKREKDIKKNSGMGHTYSQSAAFGPAKQTDKTLELLGTGHNSTNRADVLPQSRIVPQSTRRRPENKARRCI